MKLMTYHTTLPIAIDSRIYHFYATNVYHTKKTLVKILKFSGNAGGPTLLLADEQFRNQNQRLASDSSNIY